jgi:hypothetical protein
MKIAIPKVHGNSPKEKVIRSIALVLVFAAVIWAFTKNNERVVDILNKESVVYDETSTLDKEQRKFIVSFTRAMRNEFGLSSRIQVFGGDFVVPELDAKTLYIGIAPAIGEVQIRFPALMRQALGEEFAETLKTDYFLPSFAEDDWPQEIQVVLATIYEKLTDLEKEDDKRE